MCYDLDGFNMAYGFSQNLGENRKENEDIMRRENLAHEIAHIIHSQFFFGKNNIFCEGFAEAVPLYALEYEDIFDEHREALIKLSDEQILSAEQVLDSERDNTYGTVSVLPDKSCSFRISYISSYLFVRGCMEQIVRKFNLNKAQAVQFFLEIAKQSNCRFEWLVFDIANAIGASKDELLDGTKMQKDIIKSLMMKKSEPQDLPKKF